jgi:hypothetical protein
MGGNNKPLSVKKDKGTGPINEGKFKKSPKPVSPAKPSKEGARKGTVKGITPTAELLNTGQFKSKPKN